MQVVTAERATLHATAAALAGVALIQSVAAVRTPHAKANAIGAAVCVIALLHYLWMRGASDAEKRELRYGDWFVTCPLLLWELYLVTGQDTEHLGASIVAVLAMLALGLAAASAEGPMRHVLFGLACVAFAVSIRLSTQRLDWEEHGTLVAAFFGLWSLYPVAFLLRSNTMFNLLDLLSKAGIGLYIANKSFRVM